MRLKSVIICLTTIVAFVQEDLWSSPVLVGLHGKHPLGERQVGELLIGELRCGACHKDKLPRVLKMKDSPDLSEVGSRISPNYLQRFIANPLEVQSGVMMPDMLVGHSPGKRKEIAEAIAHFLTERSPRPVSAVGVGQGDFATGRKLFHDIGCIACHSPRNEQEKEVEGLGLSSLAHVIEKYSQVSLTEFLFDPHLTRPSGRMPDMKLSKDESSDLAAYLLGKKVYPFKPLRISKELVTKGQKYFREFNCAACHSLEGETANGITSSLDEVNAEKGCLAKRPKKAPDYDLSDSQRKAITKVLAGPRRKPSVEEEIAVSLTAFNCIACHSRDDYGGPSKAFLPYLHTSEEGLGNEARIPPPLTLAGAKLKPQWIRKVMFDGESARPYMHTRMPKFKEDNLIHLPEMLAKVDKVESITFVEPKRQDRGKIRSAGHQLIGDKGLNCITCHNFNGKDSPGFKGIDLLTSYERLQPSWFYRFMLNPANSRPGIVMPNYWAGGKGARKDILEGKTDAQIQAIWHYLSYGQGAPTPSGIHSPGSFLEVGEAVRTYRGRSRIAGYRGIAVGFPGGLNYAFNAETGTLSGLWRGEFVSVGWGGQGAGNFNPKSRAISLAQDLSFHALPGPENPWPLLPVMNKENPVNPDPLYPKNLGYQFLGYSLNEDFVPTFSYRIGEVLIEDMSLSVAKEDKVLLKRVLEMEVDEPQTIHFRALVGKIDKVSETIYKTPDLRLNLHANAATPNALRPLGSDKSSFELLLNLDLPKGKSQLRLDYDLLR
jgi:mono/diheme cytochrome c family protein